MSDNCKQLATPKQTKLLVHFRQTRYNVHSLAQDLDTMTSRSTSSPANRCDKRADAFEAYEKLPASYHSDPRWKQVNELRKANEHARANGLVLQIRDDYGFEG